MPIVSTIALFGSRITERSTLNTMYTFNVYINVYVRWLMRRYTGEL